MKQFISLLTTLLLIFLLSCSGVVLGAEEEVPASDLAATLTLTAPDKQYYLTGETPDYSGGYAIYKVQLEYRYPLSAENCSGLDTSTPGNKTVTVRINGLTASFVVVVLSQEEPITRMKDISSRHWSYDYFGPCMKAGYFAGDDTSRIHPDQSITRAEMCQIIYRAWGSALETADSGDENVSAPFPDVQAGQWYYEAIEACRKAGVIRGQDTGLCEPEAPITREDAVLMLMRLQYTDEELAAIDIEETVAASGVTPTDFDRVSAYAQQAMAAALGTVVFGDENNALNPGSSITRAESATILYRLFLKDYSWTRPANPPVIYLSPSNQYRNSYADVNTTEEEQMTRLAEAVGKILEAEGYTVHIAARSTSIRVRPTEAAELGADVYVPIHSNAGGNTGTFIFYNGAIPGSRELSRAIFDELAALTGTAYSENRLKEDYLSLPPNGVPFVEVGTPTMPLAYLEVEFHDRADKAAWIISHINEMAEAISTGIINYCETYLEAAS